MLNSTGGLSSQCNISPSDSSGTENSINRSGNIPPPPAEARKSSLVVTNIFDHSDCLPSCAPIEAVSPPSLLSRIMTRNTWPDLMGSIQKLVQPGGNVLLNCALLTTRTPNEVCISGSGIDVLVGAAVCVGCSVA